MNMAAPLGVVLRANSFLTKVPPYIQRRLTKFVECQRLPALPLFGLGLPVAACWRAFSRASSSDVDHFAGGGVHLGHSAILEPSRSCGVRR